MENGRFLQILQSQEKSDLKESADEELFFAEIKRQFVNSQSIIEEARARRLTLSRFQKSGAAKTNFSFLPISSDTHGETFFRKKTYVVAAAVFPRPRLLRAYIRI